ncbi:hypothetical protein C474_21006 [Halogeometricum pallidum JCM 14848]|uniref:Nickel/cobalt efflux system n=1 Tax=Halogeometricum pallidum JCM 14848 TaxID=1227487 RepID=M0CSH8_HALPD|nr:hypothetical protein [Halogeometricum pallidum]ELZ26220.1 hypothetical protein C474_21006 [Halogeometricum pallidum JCM 14848]
MASDLLGLFGGAVALGVVHGVEPGHGWPIAASYAMEKKNKWVSGAAAGTILGVGHLVSSIAMVLVFFAAKSYFDLTQLPWISQVAGVLLILLGLNELRGGGHGHDHEGNGDDGAEHGHHEPDGHHHHHEPDGHHTHDGNGGHDHADGRSEYHGHRTDHDHGEKGVVARLKSALPFVGDHSHSHSHEFDGDASGTTLWSLAWFAFVLGFAHEEEFEILLLCTGSNYCLELMSAYALAVVVGIVSLTLLLVAGYYRYEDRVESLAQHFPTISAAILILMGLGFLFGLF